MSPYQLLQVFRGWLKLTIMTTTCVAAAAAVCGRTRSSACLHHSTQQGHSLQPAGSSAWCSLAGQRELGRATVQDPQSWDKSIFYQTQEAKNSAWGRGTLSGVSRGKAPPLRSEPPDIIKCFYLSLSSVKNKFESRSMSLASGLRRRNRAPSSCSPPTRPCHVTVAPEPGLLHSASSLHTPLSRQPPCPCRRFWWLHDWAWDKVLGGQETGTGGPSLLRPSALSSPA